MKKSIYRVISISFVILFMLSACGSGPTATATPAPSEMPTLIPPPAETPTPAAKPLAALSDQAKALCTAAVDAPIAGGYIQAPGMAMIKMAYDETSDWALMRLGEKVEDGFAENADDVRNLFCVLQDRYKTNTYLDGTDAYQAYWSIMAVSWPDGKVLGKVGVNGGDPPEVKTHSGDGYGALPEKDFVQIAAGIKKGINTLFMRNTCAVISPDGQKAVTAFKSPRLSDKGIITLWDLATGHVLKSLDTSESMGQCSISFSPNGSLFAFSGFHAVTIVFDFDSGAEISRFNTRTFAFSPDGITAILADTSKNSIVDLGLQAAEIKTGKITGKFPKSHNSLVNILLFLGDGATVFSASADSFIFWDVKSRSIKTKVDTSPSLFYRNFAASSDQKLVAAAPAGNPAIWDVEKKEQRVLSKFSTFPTSMMGFLPNTHSLLYYASEEKMLYLWNVDTGEHTPIVENPAEGSSLINTFSFQPEKKMLYFIDSRGIFMQVPFLP